MHLSSKHKRQNFKRDAMNFRICPNSDAHLETIKYNKKKEYLLVPHYKQIPGILSKGHMSICSGINSTMLNIQLLYYIPDLRELVQEYVKRCPTCFRKHKIKKPIIPYKFTNHNTVAREICIDEFDFHQDYYGFTFVLVVVETTTLFVWTKACRTKRATEVFPKVHEILLTENIRPVIRTDNGSEFQAEVNTWAEGYGLKIKRIAPRKSRSNVRNFTISSFEILSVSFNKQVDICSCLYFRDPERML